jgi:hypothetical protein
MQESLLKWTGSSDTYQDYVKRYWQENLFSSLGGDGLYDNWWMTSLHDGVRVAATLPAASAATANADLGAASAGIARQAAALAGAFEVTFYEKVGTGNGMQANNPWLQELPDPVSKVVWDYWRFCIDSAEPINVLLGGDVGGLELRVEKAGARLRAITRHTRTVFKKEYRALITPITAAP